jgi:eukaryotic-like serine/threonine-protein kinase
VASRTAQLVHPRASITSPRSLGRFLILEERGPRFVVYDPALDRNVALELVSEAEARMLQAMARLSHPHAIAVHEVGVVDGRPFVVTDLVDGPTLSAWSTESRRSWREILRLFSEAGEALRAAHEEGLVHRGFTTDDVRVDAAGRARLFGVAHPTPGRRSADDVAEWVAALRRALARHAVPGWLRRTLAAPPSTMRALLVALRPPRRTAWLAIPAVAIGLAAYLIGNARAERSCSDGASLADVWDLDRKLAVHAAFEATGVPYREATWVRVRDRLDEYGNGWRGAYEEACRAESGMDVRLACLEQRRAVLGQLTAIWASGVDALGLEAAFDAAQGLPSISACALTESGEPMPESTEARRQIAAARADLARVEATRLAGRAKAGRADAAEARSAADASGWPRLRAEARIAEGELLAELREPEAETRLLEAARIATEDRADRLVATALIALVFYHGESQLDATRALAVAAQAEAFLSRSGDDPRLRVRLLRGLALAHLASDRTWASLVPATTGHALALSTLGPRDRDTLALLPVLSRVATQTEDGEAAVRFAELAVARAIEVYGDGHPQVAHALNGLGRAHEGNSAWAAAEEPYRRALAIREATLGDDDIRTAGTLGNLAWIEIALGRGEQGEALLRRAMSIWTRVHGPQHSQIGNWWIDIAISRRDRGDAAAALEAAETALAIHVAAHGEEHFRVANDQQEIGAALFALGRFAEAREAFARSAAMLIETRYPNHPQTLFTHTLLADTDAVLGHCERGLALLAERWDALEAVEPPSILASALVVRARCSPRAKAERDLMRALPIFEATNGGEVERGIARWRLGALRRRRAEVERALPELATHAGGARDLAAARAWLARRAR